ncbi:MAG: tryptophan-rich sensory protein [Lachnospiraceae bacterium]|nr:tryptophan-rich sensory protein [Lachnospiraceae bacterium]
MRLNIKQLIICIAIPLLIGSLSAFLTRDSMTTFSRVIKPPLSPPGILFPIVWTVLYALMGIASYLIISSDAAKEDVQNAIFVYALQLGINFFWSIFFFNLQWYLFSFFWLLLLWTFILYTIVVFYRISKPAAYLLIPYLLWVTFAGYLNLGIAILN